jgi:hypothetical protein
VNLFFFKGNVSEVVYVEARRALNRLGNFVMDRMEYYIWFLK